MYIELEEARQIVWRRWRDLEIRRKVRDYVGEIPGFLQQGPRAVLARQQASPNFELFRFSAAAARVGLKAVCPEYAQDKFSTRNPDKRRLGKMTFLHGRGRNGGFKTTAHKIMDFNSGDGKPFSAIRTLWGEDFRAFHHRLLSPRLSWIEVVENSPWLKEMGAEPALFWPRLMALFVCHGILFDNFHTEGHEAEFTKNIIRPAFQATEERFGLKPLIVPLVPTEKEKEAYWSWYPDCFEKEVNYLAKVQENEIFDISKKRASI
jgi:hypothetical protein